MPPEAPGPRVDETLSGPLESQITPTRLDLEVIYIPGDLTAHGIHVTRLNQNLTDGGGEP